MTTERSQSGFALNPQDELNDLRMSDKALPLFNQVKQFIQEVVQPASEKFLDYLNGIEPATLEVFDAHRHMVEAIITQVDAYADLLMAIAWSDSDGLIDATRQRFELGR